MAGPTHGNRDSAPALSHGPFFVLVPPRGIPSDHTAMIVMNLLHLFGLYIFLSTPRLTA